MRNLLSVLLFTAVSSTGSTALAEGEGYTTQDERDGYGVTFLDDLLGAEGIDATAPLLRVRPPGTRALLIRPRTSFVTQLQKTVEAL